MKKRKMKNERLILKDNVFGTGDHILFKYHLDNKGKFEAERVYSFSSKAKADFFSCFSVVRIDVDRKGNPETVSGCLFRQGKPVDSFFSCVRKKNPSEEVRLRYHLSERDFSQAKDELDVFEDLASFINQSKNVVFFSDETEISLLEGFSFDMSFSYVGFPYLASRFIREVCPSSDVLSFLGRKYGIDRDDSLLEADCVLMGKCFVKMVLSEEREVTSSLPEEPKPPVIEKEAVPDEVSSPVMEEKEENSETDEKNENPETDSLSQAKAVRVFSSDGKLIKVFDSIGQASRFTGVGNKEIRIACNDEMMKRLNKGYRFQWDE